METQWIPTITDRDYRDIQLVQGDPTLENPKGCYNAVDLNRIENDIAYCAEYMYTHRIMRVLPEMSYKHWTNADIPTRSDMRRIISNVITLMEQSNPMIFDQLPTLKVASQMNYILANQIEEALDIMHDQPELPINYWVLTLHNAKISTIERLDGTTETINASQAYIAEDEIAHLVPIPPEPDAQYKIFTEWSGNQDDLAYIKPDVHTSNARYIGQYRNVEFTANFRTSYPRRLTLTNAYISPNGDDTAESGPSTGIYYAGDNVMIIANRAQSGKAFYNWQGTEAALENISTADLDPSTVWLQMPDCDVNLNPFYINAGQHTVTVTNGTGSGNYDYGDDVYISANVPDHYGFDNWAGDTSYLDDIYSASQSFKMRDYNISFRANYSYRPSHNNVQVINGKIRVNSQDITQAQGLEERSSYTLVPTPPDNSQGIDYWQVEGYGSVGRDTLGNTNNIFTVGDGNAVITGYYAPLVTLTIQNVNNNGLTTTQQIVQGHKYRLTTNYSSGSYRFNGWYEGSTKLSSSTIYDITIGNSNMSVEARYDYYETYTVTLNNRNNSGQSTTSRVLSGNYWSASTEEEVGDNLLVGWNKNGQQVSTSTSYGFTVYGDTTINVEYRPKETYHLTVNNGTGSGDYKERQAVSITADSGDFSHWTYSNLYSIGNTTSRTTTVKLGRGNGTVTANYNYRAITVITNSGTNTYNIIEGYSRQIAANPAPSGYEFDRWVIDSGDATLGNPLSQSTSVYAHSQDSTIRATYKLIPSFTVTVQNGYIQINGEWVTSGTVLRNSQPAITMKPAPESYQFLQWEVLVGDDNDVYQQFAETTYLRNVTHNITVRATYYKPDPETTYELTITRRDGTIDTYSEPAGTHIDIYCSDPPEGLKFRRWLGDYQYLMIGAPRQRYYGGTYEIPQVVNMPARNISLTEDTYVPLDWTETFHLRMFPINIAECLVSRTEDEQTHEITEIWSTEGEYPEGTEVEIRVNYIPENSNWTGWAGATDAQTALVTEIMEQNSSIVMSDFDVDLTATTQLKQLYTFTITNGAISGQYYKDKKVSVYYVDPELNGEQHTFTRWTGDVAYISLFDGGVFDVTNPNLQEVRMPERNIAITGNYTTAYKVTINGGTITEQGQYFAPNTTIHINANTIQGKQFVKWTGDTNGIGSIYDPTTTLTITNSSKTVTATYTNETDRNNIGYGLISFIASDIINITDITIISGTIGVGFIITDIKGHIYIVTNVNQTTVTVTRMTTISKGGDVYE